MDTHYPRILDCCNDFSGKSLIVVANFVLLRKWNHAFCSFWQISRRCTSDHPLEYQAGLWAMGNLVHAVATTAYNTSLSLLLLGLGYFQRRFNTPTGYYWFISFPTVFMSHPKVKILGGETQVIQGLCNFIIDCSAKAIKDHGKFWVAFSGEKFIIIIRL